MWSYISDCPWCHYWLLGICHNNNRSQQLFTPKIIILENTCDGNIYLWILLHGDHEQGFFKGAPHKWSKGCVLRTKTKPLKTKKSLFYGEYWGLSNEYWVLSAECWVLSTKYWVLSTEDWELGTESWGLRTWDWWLWTEEWRVRTED